jgi:hypothetical protein
MQLNGLRILTLAVAVILVAACSSKKEDSQGETSEASDSKEWKEMDDFHMVMAETFHPYKDSANLEPVKSKASELVAAADSWIAAPLPKKMDNDEVKGKLETLKQESQALVQTISAGDDKAIGDQLTKVHDLFHEIQEAWYGDGDGDGHEHQH